MYTSICAAFLRKSCLERSSGITAVLCLISEDELICCFGFFWGIAGVVWLKGVYPYLSKWIEKIPMLAGKIITWCLIIFMVADSLVSAAALMRQDTA